MKSNNMISLSSLHKYTNIIKENEGKRNQTDQTSGQSRMPRNTARYDLTAGKRTKL